MYSIHQDHASSCLNSSGLIGFVPRSDTLHALIKDHRERSRPKIVGNLEHRLIQRIASDYDKLPLMMKTEVWG